MTTLPISALPGTSAKLRPLSGLDHRFWAVDKINGFNFAIAFSFSGNVAHSRWKAAFDQMQQRHPLIGSATFGGALHLVYSSFTPLPGLLKAVDAKLTAAYTDV